MRYSTSFSLGIKFINKALRQPIYNIYGFVRLADEIVDSFGGFDQSSLLAEFRVDCFKAIERRISSNPILNAFQKTVNDYKIETELINCFLKSMEMDLSPVDFNEQQYDQYILGSAQVVGLMCLQVFINGDSQIYEQLKPSAMQLGSAFQKVNFLRDLNADYLHLKRSYFPSVETSTRILLN
ncbi:phytoene/squalene synthase family protein [Pedobacter psychrodurus]|uniref:phytoene/squalene synthase family protein n=1 Tax=Pedobacter psychrodurus TaxID=2530456 RepID=UPI001CED500C|nr:squalene/phytoene synthase family protein [Pedobacter psychrodurus]